MNGDLEWQHWENLRAWIAGKPDPHPQAEIVFASPKPEPSAEEKANALAKVPEWIRCHPLFRQPTTTEPDSLVLWKEPAIESEVRR
jgi:hypothetical protein